MLQNVVGSNKFFTLIMRGFAESMARGLVEIVAPGNETKYVASARLFDNYVEDNLRPELNIKSMFYGQPLLSMNNDNCSKDIKAVLNHDIDDSFGDLWKIPCFCYYQRVKIGTHRCTDVTHIQKCMDCFILS